MFTEQNLGATMAEPRCTRCNSTTTHRKGFSDNKKRRRWYCRDCGKRDNTALDGIPMGIQETLVLPKELPESKVYVFTCAQNATPVFHAFYNALMRYCEHRNATLVVIPIRYKNPTSRWTEEQARHDYWFGEVMPYMFEGREHINTNLIVLGDVKNQPTVVSPLAGFESMSGSSSGIIGHPKIELRCIPTPNHKFPKIMVTTGSVTVKSYTETRAGKKGEFHHSFGACVVEVQDDKIFHIRQINAMRDGSFYDLNYRYSSKEVKKVDRIEALVLGDLHARFLDSDVWAATFTDKNSIVNMLRPKTLVWHDVIDFYSRSHWHRDPFVQLAKHDADIEDVLEELQHACGLLDSVTPVDTKNVLVPSNHPDALSRWVIEADWKKDPKNMETYLRTALAMVESTKMTDEGSYKVDPWLWWAQQLLKCKKRTVFLERDDPYSIKDIEIGMHGDIGPNGARGALVSFSKLGVKSVVGHSHTPGIREGAYQVGTSSNLKMEYNKGPSSWLHTHCLIYPNGKRSLVNIINGQWRSE